MAGAPATVSLEVLAGTRVRMTVTFTPLGDTIPADPAAVAFAVQSPATGAAQANYTYGVDAEVVKSATGVYHFEFVPAVRGVWFVAAKGSGASGIQAVVERAVKVDRGVITFP